MSEAQLAKHLGYSEGELAATYPGIDRAATTNGGNPKPSSRSGISTPQRIAELSDGLLRPAGRRGAEPRGGRARRVAGRRAGLPARGGRLLRRQQVLLPRRRRPGDHRLLALAGRPDHQRRHHRHPRHHPGPGADQRGGVADPEPAARAVPGRRSPAPGALHAASFGPPEAAWAACADVSAQTHVRYLDAPVRRVLSVIPTKYEDMWTGAKGFYKVEPVVADGGQVIIYAPHITEISVMHPVIEEIGYHCRDYFLGQWDRFSGYHWGDLAHSTHLRGAGTWDAEQRRAGPGDRHPGHRHPGGRGAGHQPGLPRPGGRSTSRRCRPTRTRWCCRRPGRCCTGCADAPSATGSAQTRPGSCLGVGS